MEKKEKSESYMQGLQDGVTLVASVCHTHNCEDCKLSQASGELSCMDFVANHPSEATSILLDMEQGGHSYYDEYCVRFPESEVSVEDLAATVCRKVIFEGDFTCPIEDENTCIECWKSDYPKEEE